MSGSQGPANQGPTPSGTWRHQRAHLEFDRVAFFTDAVFAIAMTLLIVTVQLPQLEGPVDAPGTLLGAMTGLLPQIFSFFLAFVLLGRYWMAHHAFLSGLKSIDRRLVAWNLDFPGAAPSEGGGRIAGAHGSRRARRRLIGPDGEGRRTG